MIICLGQGGKPVLHPSLRSPCCAVAGKVAGRPKSPPDDVPEDDRGRVFDRFTRLRPEAGGGSGLGLALVSALVQGRCGTATAGATSGGGARLEIRWPTPPPSRDNHDGESSFS